MSYFAKKGGLVEMQGAAIREIRERLGMSQEEFAEALEMSDRQLRRYEADETCLQKRWNRIWNKALSLAAKSGKWELTNKRPA